MENLVKCPQCRFEIKLVTGQKLKECPVCKFAVQTENKSDNKRVLKG